MAYSIDLCRGWERIGHLTEDASAFKFDGEIRDLEMGQWSLSAADSAINWADIEAVNEFGQTVTREAKPEDVTAIRLVDGNRIVYPGLVRPHSSGFGGLTGELG